jgi:hypothetical protein
MQLLEKASNIHVDCAIALYATNCHSGPTPLNADNGQAFLFCEISRIRFAFCDSFYKSSYNPNHLLGGANPGGGPPPGGN